VRHAVTRATGVGLALVLLAAPGGHAHEVAPADVVPVLDRLPPRLAGITVQLVRTLDNEVIVENRTGAVLEVLDEAGTPFLRLGPAGAEANLAAAAWYRTASAGEAAIPERARSGGAAPEWVRVSTTPAWGWFDRRLRRDPPASPPPGRAPSTPREGVAERWRIPMRLAGAPVTLGGHFRVASPVGGRFEARLTSGDSPLPGVRVSLVGGRVPALYLENTSDEEVVVLGDAGEPFLGIGPSGTRANVQSPTWRHSGKAAVTLAPVPVDPATEPVWQLAAPVPRYAWIEFRAGAPVNAPAGATRRGVVRRWRVPLRRGRARAEVRGVVEWIPRIAAPIPLHG
jgi:hypothetical protein